MPVDLSGSEADEPRGLRGHIVGLDVEVVAGSVVDSLYTDGDGARARQRRVSLIFG